MITMNTMMTRGMRLPNAECVEDGSIDRKVCRKLSWDFKKKYSFRIGAFRRDFLD